MPTVSQLRICSILLLAMTAPAQAGCAPPLSDGAVGARPRAQDEPNTPAPGATDRPYHEAPASGGERMVESVRIVVEVPSSPLVGKAAALLREQITARCAAAICSDDRGELRVALGLEPGIGAEGFRIEKATDGAVRIVGNDERGLIYGVGRFLRGSRFGEGVFGPSAWRGDSTPEKPVRGIYFGAFANYYCTAPADEIRRYLEELALWGCNALAVVLPLAPAGADDQAGLARLARQRAIIEAARDVGMSVGVLIIANGVPVPAPELRAQGPGRGAFVSDESVCPSIPRGRELLLKQFDAAFAALADVSIDHLVIWPYDAGSCDCERCRPWGSNGFLRIAEAEADLFRRHYPKGKVILATWYFDDGEWAALEERFRERPVWADYILADNALAHFPTFPVEHGVPGDLPMVSFPEISMWDTGGWGPWGGFGANPAPGLLQRSWDQAGAKLAGGYPYSEGIFEDVNKVIALQFCWDAGRKAVDVVREYAAFEYSPDVADDVVTVVGILEANGPRLLLDQEAGRYELRKDEDGVLRGVVRLAQPDAGAEGCYQLLAAADRKLSTYARNSWRWRILLLRAIIDKELVAHNGLLTAECEQATRELDRIYHAEGAPPTVKPPYAEWLFRVNAASGRQ
jgi:hypothetical protein